MYRSIFRSEDLKRRNIQGGSILCKNRGLCSFPGWRMRTSFSTHLGIALFTWEPTVWLARKKVGVVEARVLSSRKESVLVPLQEICKCNRLKKCYRLSLSRSHTNTSILLRRKRWCSGELCVQAAKQSQRNILYIYCMRFVMLIILVIASCDQAGPKTDEYQHTPLLIATRHVRKHNWYQMFSAPFPAVWLVNLWEPVMSTELTRAQLMDCRGLI